MHEYTLVYRGYGLPTTCACIETCHRGSVSLTATDVVV